MSDFEEDAEEDPIFDTDPDRKEETEFEASADDSEMERTLSQLPSLPEPSGGVEIPTTPGTVTVPDPPTIATGPDGDADEKRRKTLSPTPSDSGGVLLEIDGRFELVSADDIRARDLGILAADFPSPSSTASKEYEADTEAHTKPPGNETTERDQVAEEKGNEIATGPVSEDVLGTTEDKPVGTANGEPDDVAAEPNEPPGNEGKATDMPTNNMEVEESTTSASSDKDQSKPERGDDHQPTAVSHSPPRTAPPAVSLLRATTSSTRSSSSIPRWDTPPRSTHPRRGKSAVARREEQEARERQAREEARRADAQAAFDAWLAQKREKEAKVNKERTAARAEQERMEETRRIERIDERTENYSAWLSEKQRQRQEQRRFQQREEELAQAHAVLISQERNQQAYEQWVANDVSRISRNCALHAGKSPSNQRCTVKALENIQRAGVCSHTGTQC